MLKMSYDPKTDILQVMFASAPLDEKKEQNSDVIIHYDKDGKVIGVELKHASSKMNSSWSLDFEPAIRPDIADAILNWETSSAEEIIAHIKANRTENPRDNLKL